MNKRILSILLTLCTVICLVPTAVFAATQTAGSWSGLQNLINSTDNLSVSLSSDISWGGSPLTVPAGKTVTLDLNGKAIDAQNNGTVIVVNGTLTIKNSGADLAGPIGVGAGPITGNIKNGKAVDQKAGGILVASGGKLVMNSGWLTNCVDDSGQISAAGGIYVSENASFEMAGGIITGCTGSNLLCAAGVVNYGTFTMSGNATISGSKTKYTSSNGVAVCNAGTLNANGGTVQTGQLCTNYATIQSTGKNATVFYCNVSNTGMGTISGGTYNYPVENYGIITGGIFNGTVTSGGTINDGIFNGTVDNTRVVTGGTFNGTTTGIYTVTFDSGVPSQIRANAPATAPVAPTRKGYTFKCWLKDGTPYDFTQDVTQNISLTADWTAKSYTVKFDTAGGTAITDKPLSWSDKVLNGISAPSKVGYDFNGWKCGGRTISTNTTYADLATDDNVTSITLTADWTVRSYTVKFDTVGGTTIADKTNVQLIDKVLDGVTDPERIGYDFIGWKCDGKMVSADTTYADLAADDNVTSITLTADWTEKSYTVKFDTAGGTAIADKTNVKWTDKVLEGVADPEKIGYDFIGWKCDGRTISTNTTYADLATDDNVTSITLTADWTEKSYTVKFDTVGGTVISDKLGVKWTDKVLEGITDPQKIGYDFNGWKCGDRTITKDTTYADLAVDDNVTTIILKAEWQDNEKPTGKIEIDKYQWESIPDEIIFGLFFKDAQKVTITASDSSKEPVKIEYLLSDKKLSDAELASAVFTEYTDPFNITPVQENMSRVIVYVKLTDKADNVTYISSNGIVMDSIKPIIRGVESGKTYCEAQTVTIDEEYIDTVTVINGTEVRLDKNGRFVLSPADGEQKIIVKDKAGNTAEMTVTVNNGHTALADDGDCTTPVYCRFCNEEAVAAKHHDFTGAWHSDENSHWHECQNENCSIAEIKAEHSGGKASCKDKAICEDCGKAYGDLDATNHADLKHVPAKAATKDAEGNIEYWYCKACGKVYGDAAATKEITKADTVIKKLTDAPKTGDRNNLLLWISLLLVSGGAAISAYAVSNKKRKSN